MRIAGWNFSVNKYEPGNEPTCFLQRKPIRQFGFVRGRGISSGLHETFSSLYRIAYPFPSMGVILLDGDFAWNCSLTKYYSPNQICGSCLPGRAFDLAMVLFEQRILSFDQGNRGKALLHRIECTFELSFSRSGRVNDSAVSLTLISL